MLKGIQSERGVFRRLEFRKLNKGFAIFVMVLYVDEKPRFAIATLALSHQQAEQS